MPRINNDTKLFNLIKVFGEGLTAEELSVKSQTKKKGIIFLSVDEIRNITYIEPRYKLKNNRITFCDPIR